MMPAAMALRSVASTTAAPAVAPCPEQILLLEFQLPISSSQRSNSPSNAIRSRILVTTRPGVQHGGLRATGQGPRSALQLQLPGDSLDPEERHGEARQTGVAAGQGAGAASERGEVLLH